MEGKRSSSSGASIKVVVRVRPLNTKERVSNPVVKILTDEDLVFDPLNPLVPTKKTKNLPFNFDRVFGTDGSNYDVFADTTEDFASQLLEGYNCSVFAYGATGSGKTHTMLGHGDKSGVIFLTVGSLFERVRNLSDDVNVEMQFSYVEIYNEDVKDLLNPGAKVQLRESGSGVNLVGATSVKISCVNEVERLLVAGNKSRTQHATEANMRSSRSHAIIQISLKIQNSFTGEVHSSKLNMIDLAGSERASATGCTGVRLTEGANINRSLLALGNCIKNLADGLSYIPYRESKLTRLLKDSLSGNCKTVMIVNISSSCSKYEDTYNTLNYAARARKVKTVPTKNAVASNEAQIYLNTIAELQMENRSLREKLGYNTQAQQVDVFEKIAPMLDKIFKKMKESCSTSETFEEELKEFVAAQLNTTHIVHSTPNVSPIKPISPKALNVKRKSVDLQMSVKKSKPDLNETFVVTSPVFPSHIPKIMVRTVEKVPRASLPARFSVKNSGIPKQKVSVLSNKSWKRQLTYNNTTLVA